MKITEEKRVYKGTLELTNEEKRIFMSASTLLIRLAQELEDAGQDEDGNEKELFLYDNFNDYAPCECARYGYGGKERSDIIILEDISEMLNTFAEFEISVLEKGEN